MKNVFLLICIVFVFQSFGQKKYSFDCALAYKEQCKLHEKPTEMIYLINTQKNNYTLFTHQNKDSTILSIHFRDELGVSVNGAMNKNDFYKAETITNECTQTFRYKGLVKENYKIENCNDTIINDTSYYHYKLFSLKSLSYQKRKNIVTAHFIVDKKNTLKYDFTMASLIFNIDSNKIEIPFGIAKTIYYTNTEGIITSKMELNGIIKVDKYLTIPEECDYTKDEIRNYKPTVTFNR